MRSVAQSTVTNLKAAATASASWLARAWAILSTAGNPEGGGNSKAWGVGSGVGCVVGGGADATGLSWTVTGGTPAAAVGGTGRVSFPEHPTAIAAASVAMATEANHDVR